MKYYAVLDTNVIVSAMLKTSSVPGQVAAEALHGDIIPVLNDEIIAEYEDVLSRPKFRFDKRTVKVFLEERKKYLQKNKNISLRAACEEWENDILYSHKVIDPQNGQIK